jgi:hypothetical protein
MEILAKLLRALAVLSFANARAPREAARTAEGSPLRATIDGMIVDSVAMQPLSRALVQLVARDNPADVRSVRSDSAGRFAFDSVAAGAYLIGFLHPKLDSLLLRSPVMSVDIGADQGAATVALGIPSVAAISALFCGSASSNERRPGLMLGRLRTSDRSPVDSGAGGVRARWRALRVDEQGVRAPVDSATFETRGTSEFALCGLPPEGTFTAQAWIGGDSSGVVEFAMPGDGIVMRDLVVPSGTRAAPLVGFVRDSGGAGVARARVAATDRDLITQTDTSGRFALSGIALGSQSLDIRALGFAPLRAVVDVLNDESAQPQLALARTTTTLETVTVRDLRSYAGFDVRRASSAGLFLDEETIKRRKPWTFTELMKNLPGVAVPNGAPAGAGFDLRYGTKSCEPNVWVDGVPQLGRTRDLDSYINVENLRAVEIYSQPGEAPTEFLAVDRRCGSVLIWTRRPDR